MAGGADNDTYVVDDAGDVVTKSLAGSTESIGSSRRSPTPWVPTSRT